MALCPYFSLYESSSTTCITHCSPGLHSGSVALYSLQIDITHTFSFSCHATDPWDNPCTGNWMCALSSISAYLHTRLCSSTILSLDFRIGSVLQWCKTGTQKQLRSPGLLEFPVTAISCEAAEILDRNHSKAPSGCGLSMPCSCWINYVSFPSGYRSFRSFSPLESLIHSVLIQMPLFYSWALVALE